MKTLITLLLIAPMGAAALPETGPITFTNLHGKVIKDAKIELTNSLTVFYTTADGPSHIAWTDLPPDVQARLGYDLASGAKAQQAAAVQRQIQGQSLADAAWTGEPCKMRIVKNVSLDQYQVEMTRDKHVFRELIALQNLPLDTVRLFARLNLLRNDLAGMHTSALTPGSAAMARTRIGQVQNELAELEQLELGKSYILAGITHLQSGGIELWRYLGRSSVDAADPEAVAAPVARRARTRPPPRPQSLSSSVTETNPAAQQPIPADVAQAIRKRAEEKYPNDYEQQATEVKKQTDAYRALNP